MTIIRLLVLPAALAAVLAAPALGQTPATADHARPDTAAPAGGPFDRLHFRSIGPAVTSGRIDDFAVLERDPRIFYIATATGGLWKTTNNGVTLTPVFDSASLASIGAVRIPADDPNLVWVGTGENNNRQSSSWGDGVYKSTDGGKSWKNMGLRDSKQIARIVIDPVDHDVVYVAALGDLWKSGGDRGIYKTADGGLTWAKVLDAGPDAGGTELVMDPANNKVLYAAMYQRRRASWGMNGGGPNSGIWKSTDAGRSWIHLTKGLPEGPIGRIGLDIFRKNPSIVYARVEHAKEGGVYRSDDAGMSWTKMGSTNGRPMYFGIIKVDPANDLRVYEPITPMLVSDDGGKTFRSDGAPNDSRGLPRHVDRPEQRRPHDDRRRRRRRHHATTRGRSGSGCRTCRWASSITSASTCRTRTTSAADCRTTIPGAGPVRRARRTASATTPGSPWSVATASFR